MPQTGVEFYGTLVEEDDGRDLFIETMRQRRRFHEAMRHDFKIDEVQQTIKRMRKAGKPYSQIATYLNLQGYISPGGKQFYAMTVKRLEDDPIVR
jgi:hypothetical protein